MAFWEIYPMIDSNGTNLITKWISNVYLPNYKNIEWRGNYDVLMEIIILIKLDIFLFLFIQYLKYL